MGAEPGVAELKADIAGQGGLGQEIVAQRELGFDGADIVGELAGEGFTIGAGAGKRGECDHDSADAVRKLRNKILGRLRIFLRTSRHGSRIKQM
jgi:hypothetical protein